jgi:hypothetical protein
MSTIVRVLPSLDDVFDASHVGRLGLVTKLMFESSWSIGETLDDPLVIVRFSDGTSDGFWREELELVHALA